MKKLKLSKTSQLMLAAGVFIVILASLGITRSQQTQEKIQLDEQLFMSEKRLENLTVAELQEQLDELQKQYDGREAAISGARDNLSQNIESVEVTDRFFQIAEEDGVTVTGLSTTAITEVPVEDIVCSMISLSAAVSGNVTDLVSFIIDLNEDYVSGYIQTAQVVIPESIEDAPTASIQMNIYAYEGED